MGYFFGVPRVPKEIASRPRLSERLSADVALTVVRGSSGMGKTVAVADWASQHAETPGSVPGIWLSIDSESRSRFGLWVALLDQIRASGLIGEDDIISPLIAAVESTPRLSHQLSRVLARISEGVVIVIDNGHLIDDADAAELSADIALIVQATPRLRVILIAHGELELERGEYGIVLATATIDSTELALTVHETREVMMLAGLTGGLDAGAVDLHAATAGHPLLVRGALIADDKGLITPTLREGAPMLAAAVAAVWEIANARHWSRDEIDFALASSIADGLSVSLAIELTGHRDPQSMLDYFASLGVGIWETDGPIPRFRYVPALREVLLKSLYAADPAQAVALHRIAATSAFEQWKSISALRHAVAAGDLELVDRFLFRDWSELTRLHGASVRDLLGGLSRPELSTHPFITFTLAIATVASPAHDRGAIELFTLAARSAENAALATDATTPGLQSVLLFTVSSVARRLCGHHSASLAAAGRAMASYEALSPSEWGELDSNRASLFVHLGLSAHHAGDFDLALQHYALAATTVGHPRIFAGLGGLALQTGLLAGLGRLTEAAPLLERAREAVWPPGWLTGYTGTYLQIAEAYFAIEARDYARAHAHLDSLASHMPTVEHWEAIARVRAWTLLGEGRAAEAVAHLRAESRKQGRRLDGTRLSLYNAQLALCEVASGNARAAELILLRQPSGQPLTSVAEALLELSRGRTVEALGALDAMDTSAAVSMHALANARMVRAAILLRNGSVSDAKRSLREATAMMAEHGTSTIPLMIPGSDREALQCMAADGGPGSELAILQRAADSRQVFAPLRFSEQLSEREQVVLRQLVRTGSTVEIAATLFVSHNTVKSQLRSLYRKLRVGSRAEALVAAHAQGLLGESAG